MHLAALVSVAESMNNPRKCQNTNVNSLFSLLEYALKAKTRKIVFASSAAVYGDNLQLSQSETDLPAPKSFYGLSKLDGEHILKIFQKEHNIPFTGFRMFNVFGPGQSPESDYASVIPCFIRYGKQNEPLQIHGDGEQKRDFIYVKQVVEYYAAAIESDFTGICNIGSGQSTSVRELAEIILRELGTGTKSQTVFTPARPGDIRNSLANITLLQKHFKQVRTRDFKTAMQETIAAS
jgi:UDP-glucose 4-epimerase